MKRVVFSVQRTFLSIIDLATERVIPYRQSFGYPLAESPAFRTQQHRLLIRSPHLPPRAPPQRPLLRLFSLTRHAAALSPGNLSTGLKPSRNSQVNVVLAWPRQTSTHLLMAQHTLDLSKTYSSPNKQAVPHCQCDLSADDGARGKWICLGLREKIERLSHRAVCRVLSGQKRKRSFPAQSFVCFCRCADAR